jgi:hypothetical protein
MHRKIHLKSSDEIRLLRPHSIRNMVEITKIFLMISIKREAVWADLDLETGIGLIAKL